MSEKVGIVPLLVEVVNVTPGMLFHEDALTVTADDMLLPITTVLLALSDTKLSVVETVDDGKFPMVGVDESAVLFG